MARHLSRRVLRHRATAVAVVEGDTGTWVEGEPGDGPEPVAGTPFACILFLPLAGETTDEQTWRPARTVTRPTLMWNLADVADRQPTQGMELWIDAPDLAGVVGSTRARWIVEGEPQPFGPPGAAFAAQAIVRRVSGP